MPFLWWKCATQSDLEHSMTIIPMMSDLAANIYFLLPSALSQYDRSILTFL